MGVNAVISAASSLSLQSYGEIFLLIRWLKRRKREKIELQLLKQHEESDCAYKYALKTPDFGLIGESFNPFVLDACSGIGWLPAYDYPVSVAPPITDLTPFIKVLRKVENPDNEEDKFFKTIDKGLLIKAKHKASTEFQKSLYAQWVEKKHAHEVNISDYCCFHIVPDEKEHITAKQMEQFWGSLISVEEPMSFEIIADGRTDKIVFQFLCLKRNKDLVARMLSPYFKEINEQGNDEDCLKSFFGGNWLEELGNGSLMGGRMGLCWHYTRLLKTFNTFEQIDPLMPLISNLETILNKDRLVVIQFLICPTYGVWENHLQQLSQIDFVYWPDFEECDFRQKVTSPLYSVVFRSAVISREIENLTQPLADTLNAFASFSNPPDGNEFSIASPFNEEGVRERWQIPKIYRDVGGYMGDEDWVGLFSRNTNSHGFILNLQELTGLCHFPSKSLQSPKLLKKEKGEVPEEMTAGGLLIGVNELHSKEQQVYIPERFRDRHTYVVGITGMGKTTLLTNMIKQDIDTGNGVGVIDVHGDLIRDHILPIIPEHRMEDVILFDPTDEEYPIGFNMLQVENEAERDRIRDDIVLTIERISETSWAEQMDYLFNEAVGTLLADRDRHTMLDATRMIMDDPYRFEVLQRVEDDFVKTFWRDVFPSVTESTKMAVVRRLSDVFRDRKVRNIFAQKETAFSFKDIMDNRKIFLARVPRGALPSTHRLFGKVLVSKIQLTAMAREAIPEEGRVPFYLYIDEFQHFVEEAFEEILAEARKYRLCLTLSHQYTAQLPEKILKAVGIVGSLIVFRLELDDARAIAPQLGPFTVDDILNLDDYHTITKIGRAKDAFSMRTLPPPKAETDLSEKIRQLSREKYCRKPIIEEPKRDEPKPTKPEFFE